MKESIFVCSRRDLGLSSPSSQPRCWAATLFCIKFGNGLESTKHLEGISMCRSPNFFLHNQKICTYVPHYTCNNQLTMSSTLLSISILQYKMTSHPSVLAGMTDKKNQNVYYYVIINPATFKWNVLWLRWVKKDWGCKMFFESLQHISNPNLRLVILVEWGSNSFTNR